MKINFKRILITFLYFLDLPSILIFPPLALLIYFLLRKIKFLLPLYLRIIFVILTIIIWRPFIIAMWYLHKSEISLTLFIIYLILRKKKVYLTFKNFELFYTSFLSVVFLFLALSVLTFTMPTIKQDKCAEVINNKKIKPLFSFCNKNWQKEVSNFVKDKNKILIYFADARSIFVGENTRYIYLGFGTQDSPDKKALIKFDRIKGKIKDIIIMHSIFRGIYNPKYKVFYLAVPFWKYKGIYILSEKKFKIIKKIPTSQQPLFFALDKKKNNLFVGEHYHNLEVYKIKNKNQIKLLKTLLEEVSPGYLLFSEKLKKIYAGSALPTICYLYIYDYPDFNRKVRFINPLNFLLSFGIATGIALDEKENLLYVSYPLEGAIYVFNAKNLELKDKIKTTVGVREIAYDEERKILFLGQYLKGYIEVINVKNKKTIDKIFIGRKIREIFYAKELKKVFATSINGLFEIDVSNLNPF